MVEYLSTIATFHWTMMVGETVTAGMESKSVLFANKNLCHERHIAILTPHRNQAGFNIPQQNWFGRILSYLEDQSPYQACQRLPLQGWPRHDRCISGVIYSPYIYIYVGLVITPVKPIYLRGHLSYNPTWTFQFWVPKGAKCSIP